MGNLMPREIRITVRQAYGTYNASAKGCPRASATAGPQLAARSLAIKAFGHPAFFIEKADSPNDALVVFIARENMGRCDLCHAEILTAHHRRCNGCGAFVCPACFKDEDNELCAKCLGQTKKANDKVGPDGFRTLESLKADEAEHAHEDQYENPREYADCDF